MASPTAPLQGCAGLELWVLQNTNWWVIGAVGFCLLAWASGIAAVTKTTYLYTHRSDAGFRHDVFEHARAHWLTMKRMIDPASAETRRG